MKRWLQLCVIGLVITVTACEPDDNDDPAVNYQEDFVGTWNCNETKGINAQQFYTVVIEEGSNSSKIVITKLYNDNSTRVMADLNGLSFTIPEQTSSGIDFSGTGKASVNFNQINITFTASDGGGADLVEAVLTK